MNIKSAVHSRVRNCRQEVSHYLSCEWERLWFCFVQAEFELITVQDVTKNEKWDFKRLIL